MTTWVASDNFTAWIADCGPYIGPWPPAPPIPANVPPGYGVDYVITTDAVTDVASGSWSGLDVWRYHSGSVGSGIGDPVIPGGHLIVAVEVGDSYPFTWPTAAPAADALTFVPALYVTGGTGAPVPDPAAGHWSDWMDYPPGLTYSGDGTSFARYLEQRGETIAHGATGIVDVEPIETALIGDVTTSDALITESPLFYDVQFGVRAVKDSISNSTGVTVADSGFHQSDWAFTGNFTLEDWGTLTGSSGVLDGLIEGIDYVYYEPIGVTPSIDFEGGRSSAFDAWTTADIDYTTVGSDGGSTPALNYTDVTARIGLVTGAVPADGTPGTSDGAGSTLATIDIHYPDTGTSGSTSVDIAGTSEHGFYLNFQVDGLATIAAPLTDWGDPGGQTFYQVEWQLLVDSMHGNADVTFPRWRYWIPGGPVLKTVGENFRSVGGAQIKSLIGGVWVPVQRHG